MINILKITAVVALGALMACTTSCIRKKVDYGKHTEKKVNVQPFTQIVLQGDASVQYVHADSFSVKIVGSEKLIPEISIQQHGDTLIIAQTERKLISGTGGLWTGINFNSPSVIISSPKLKRVAVAGQSSASFDGTMEADSVMFTANAQSVLNLDGVKANFIGLQCLNNSVVNADNINGKKVEITTTDQSVLNITLDSTRQSVFHATGNSVVNIDGSVFSTPVFTSEGNSVVNNDIEIIK